MTKREYVYLSSSPSLVWLISYSYMLIIILYMINGSPKLDNAYAWLHAVINWYWLLERINNFHWDYPCDLAKFLLFIDRFTYYRSIKAECSYAENRTWDVACQVTDSFASAKNITEIFFSLLVYSYATFGTGWINLVFFFEKTIFQLNWTIWGAMGKNCRVQLCSNEFQIYRLLFWPLHHGEM